MKIINFLATVEILNFAIWNGIYTKYESRHLRIKVNDEPLFLTLFGIKTIENNGKEIIIEGEILLSDEEKHNSPVEVNRAYDFVFQEGKIFLGKIVFLEFEK